jgi:hypothetical protein
MTQDAREHRLLGDRGNAPERAAPTKGTCGISRAHTHPRSLAQFQEGVLVFASSTSTPCWRGVGIIASRSALCGAKQPAERTRWTRGKGTSAASFSKRSNGDSLMPVVPSDHGREKV